MPGFFKNQYIKDIFVEIAEGFSERGWLALYFLMVEEEPVAAQFCAEYNQKMLYFLGGFDVEFSKYSVGNLITAKIIEACIKRGVKEYDFLKGAESYKFRWTKQFRRNYGFRFTNGRAVSFLSGRAMKLVKLANVDSHLKTHLAF